MLMELLKRKIDTVLNGWQFRTEIYRFAEQNGFPMSTCSANLVFPVRIELDSLCQSGWTV